MKRSLISLVAFFALMLSATAQITAPVVEQRPDTDNKYLAGAVLEHDGFCYLTRTVSVPAELSQADVMQRLQTWLDRCMKDERVLYQQSLPSPADNQLMHSVMMQITFSKSMLSHDFADMTYVIYLTANPGEVVMNIERITYKYREGDNVKKYTAEEMISDGFALNKKGRLILGYKRFRIKTIDFVDELEASLQKALQ